MPASVPGPPEAKFARIAVVGSGALGIYFGVKLALSGADVRFLMRGDLAAVRKRGSLAVKENGGMAELRPVAAFGTPEEVGEVDLVLVTLKATANRELPRLLKPLLGPRTAILTLQNGIGPDEEIAGHFGPERVLGGLAFIAANRTGPGEVTCLHSPTIVLGEFGCPVAERTRALARQFEAAGVRMRLAESLLEARWRKLVWNIPFNGLSVAAGGVATDRICGDPLLAAEVRALMAEVQRAGAAFGFNIPDEFLRQQFDVTPPMGPYRPSTLVDYLEGREVEVEPIWGEPLRRARAAGVAMPRLSMLYALLKALNETRRQRAG
jgi:2-dehydropantoate 2-reductase